MSWPKALNTPSNNCMSRTRSKPDQWQTTTDSVTDRTPTPLRMDKVVRKKRPALVQGLAAPTVVPSAGASAGLATSATSCGPNATDRLLARIALVSGTVLRKSCASTNTFLQSLAYCVNTFASGRKEARRRARTLLPSKLPSME